MTYVANLVGTRLLTITIDSVDWSAQVSTGKITAAAADSDFVSFEDAASGGARQYNLEFTAAQDLQADSLWDQVFSNAGDTVSFTLAPYGVAASATAPTFTGNAVITEPDGDYLGGDANASTTAKMVFSCVWPCTAKPTRVTGA